VRLHRPSRRSVRSTPDGRLGLFQSQQGAGPELNDRGRISDGCWGVFWAITDGFCLHKYGRRKQMDQMSHIQVAADIATQIGENALSGATAGANVLTSVAVRSYAQVDDRAARILAW
jgi:hypothetical protein